jgi:hypothetical protein
MTGKTRKRQIFQGKIKMEKTQIVKAMKWLEKAIDMAGKKDIRTMALDDPDLEPLRVNISEI